MDDNLKALEQQTKDAALATAQTFLEWFKAKPMAMSAIVSLSAFAGWIVGKVL